MSGDFTDNLEWGGCPNDFDNQWVDRLRDSVVGVVLTGWSPLQQKLGALLQARLFKVEELEDKSYHHTATPPPFSLTLRLWRLPRRHRPWDFDTAPPNFRVPHRTNSRGRLSSPTTTTSTLPTPQQKKRKNNRVPTGETTNSDQALLTDVRKLQRRMARLCKEQKRRRL